MTGIILAAGVGSRLRPLTDSVPKCLVPVAGKPVLGWQLDALLGAGLERVRVVAGYRAGQVQRFCAAYGPAVEVLVNEDYERTNNMFSLRLALDGRPPAPLVLCNGDVVFDPRIARAIAANGTDNLIAAEPGRYIEESMKITVDRSGRITGLSKSIAPDAAYGVSIDVYGFTPAGVEAIARSAERLIGAEGQVNLWTEVAIQAVLGDIFVKPLDIQGAPWIEIDNLQDLAEGERLFHGAAAP